MQFLPNYSIPLSCDSHAHNMQIHACIHSLIMPMNSRNEGYVSLPSLTIIHLSFLFCLLYVPIVPCYFQIKSGVMTQRDEQQTGDGGGQQRNRDGTDSLCSHNYVAYLRSCYPFEISVLCMICMIGQVRSWNRDIPMLIVKFFVILRGCIWNEGSKCTHTKYIVNMRMRCYVL